MRFRFGEFVLDLGRHELRGGTEVVHLTPKAMELLTILIRSRPNMIPKDELIDRLWPDAVVVPANLRNLVSELRSALRDQDPGSRFIRTVHGCGYGFTEKVELIAHGPGPTARLVCVKDPRLVFRLALGPNLVGRAIDCDLMIDSSQISRHHARITVSDDVRIEDLQSRNGTYVSGERIRGIRRIYDGDEIAFGSVLMRLRTRTRDASTDTFTMDSPPG